jgi:hypothetical protein
MRSWHVGTGFLLLSLALLVSPSESKSPQTIEGCVMSINGAFMLGTPNGERYVLKGDHDTLFSYNGKQVQITGTVKKSSSGSPSSQVGPRTLKVSDIKKVYDTCQF